MATTELLPAAVPWSRSARNALALGHGCRNCGRAWFLCGSCVAACLCVLAFRILKQESSYKRLMPCCAMQCKLAPGCKALLTEDEVWVLCNLEIDRDQSLRNVCVLKQRLARMAAAPRMHTCLPPDHEATAVRTQGP